MRPPEHFRLADCADDVAALASVLEIDHLIPVGYSMGGPIAQLVWKRHPSRVDGMVLCATAMRFSSSSRDQRMFYTGLGGLALASRLTPRVLQRRLVNELVMRPDATGPELWARDQIRRHNPTAVREASRAIGQFSSRAWIGEVDVPTAVVVTTQDQLVSPRRQLALAEAIPGATVHRVDAGHDAAVYGADRFVPALLDACASVASRASATGNSRVRSGRY
jgi:3-oxoadipate enol-lactonase